MLSLDKNGREATENNAVSACLEIMRITQPKPTHFKFHRDITNGKAREIFEPRTKSGRSQWYLDLLAALSILV